MDADAAARVRAGIEASAASGVHAPVAEAVERGLAAADGLVTLPRGTTVCFRGHQRVLELDRHGTLLAALDWRDDGLLHEAAVRLADHSWITIEPRAATVAPWGTCDRLWHVTAPRRDPTARPLSVMTALEWSRITGIPTLATPALLPSGAGTVVLNLIASLAEDAGARELVYRGPYPTEQLFTTLLDSFICASPGDPLEAFVAGELRWRPAPYERAFVASDLHVQSREQIEAVRWRGRTYHRSTGHRSTGPAVARYAPRRVRDVDDHVRCSLWALGQVIEDHLELTRAGELVAILPASRGDGDTRSIGAVIVSGIAAAIAATSAPPLAAPIRGIGEHLHVVWAPVNQDLVSIDGDAIAFASRLRTTTIDTLTTAQAHRARVAIAFALLGELAGLLGDTLRARAQESLTALPDAEQAAALEQSSVPPSNTAKEISQAVEALLTDLDTPR